VSAPSLTPADLRSRLDGLTLRDADRIGRRLDQLRRGKHSNRNLTQIAEQITRGEQLLAARTAAVPTITYPDLPVSARRDDIAAAIRDNQVVVVAGETGSGKTTQLPKICLELGRGIRATIGHTQPRRLAARTVAQRIADELQSPLGEAVGYTVRFTDQASDRTLVKLMTDGILLAEMQRDRRLLRYDTLILDEAHERSLNIDFLLGYLAQLLPRRPDLKVVVTSATIEPERFAAHFGGARSSRCPDAPTPSRSGTARSNRTQPAMTAHPAAAIRTTRTTTSSIALRCATRPRRSSTRCAN
jgi:ATP-dependent helicase HrpA